MKRLVFALAALLLPLAAAAQEATLNGTVTDSTGSVLPGVTVQALHEASGNTFMAVTDGRGAFQLPVRVGTYKITVQLQGFTTVTQSGVEVLVGQTATVNVQMSPSTLAETITVTGESPLVETTSSRCRATSIRGRSRSSVAGPQLDVAGAARAGQPHQRAGRDCRCRTEATFANSSSTSMACR